MISVLFYWIIVIWTLSYTFQLNTNSANQETTVWKSVDRKLIRTIRYFCEFLWKLEITDNLKIICILNLLFWEQKVFLSSNYKKRLCVWHFPLDIFSRYIFPTLLFNAHYLFLLCFLELFSKGCYICHIFTLTSLEVWSISLMIFYLKDMFFFLKYANEIHKKPKIYSLYFLHCGLLKIH